MSDSTCCFLTCIQLSYKTVKVVWYSHLFKNFPQFVVIHTVKGFSIVNEAEVDVFLEFPCFLYDPVSVCSLISGPPAFSEPSLYIWKLLLHVLLKLRLKDLEHYLASMWNKCICMVVWLHCLSLRLEKKWPFPVLWPLLSFPNLLAYWVQHFHSIIF